MIKRILDIASYIDIIQRIKEKHYDACDPLWYELFKNFRRLSDKQFCNMWEPQNLPTFPPAMKTVVLHREQLEQFRDDFVFMQTLIALIVRNPRWAKIDIMRFCGMLGMLYRKESEEEDEG